MGRALSLLWQQGDPKGASTSKSCLVYAYRRTAHRSPRIIKVWKILLWVFYGTLYGPCMGILWDPVETD